MIILLGLLNTALWLTLLFLWGHNHTNPEIFNWVMILVFCISGNGLLQAIVAGGHKETFWIKLISLNLDGNNTQQNYRQEGNNWHDDSDTQRDDYHINTTNPMNPTNPTNMLQPNHPNNLYPPQDNTHN